MAHVTTHEQFSLLEPKGPELPLEGTLQPIPMIFKAADPAREPTIINAPVTETPTPPIEVVDDGVSVKLTDYYTGLHGLLQQAKPLDKNIRFLEQTDQQDSDQYTAIRLHMGLSKAAMEERVGKSKEANKHLKKAAKVQFADTIFAQDALVDAGLVTREVSKVLARSEYADLTSHYFDPHNRKAREARLEDIEDKLAALVLRSSAATDKDEVDS